MYILRSIYVCYIKEFIVSRVHYSEVRLYFVYGVLHTLCVLVCCCDYANTYVCTYYPLSGKPLHQYRRGQALDTESSWCQVLLLVRDMLVCLTACSYFPFLFPFPLPFSFLLERFFIDERKPMTFLTSFLSSFQFLHMIMLSCWLPVRSTRFPMYSQTSLICTHPFCIKLRIK